jgi:hypothetical protein
MPHFIPIGAPDMQPRSRGAMRPKFCKEAPPKKRALATLKKGARDPQKRGRGEDRVRAAPAVSCALMCKKCAHEHTGSAEAIRPSLRNGFTAYSVLSSVNGLSCHRCLAEDDASQTRLGGCASTRRDASVGASGPHDFAVRDPPSPRGFAGRSPLKFWRRRNKRQSSARWMTAHGKPALRSPFARLTPSRPSHPNPRSRRSRNAPQRAGRRY